MRPVTGTTFLRSGFNMGNMFLSFLPGSFAFSYARQKLNNKMYSRTQNQLLLGRNVVGLMIGAYILSAFADKDDEEEGWHGEGNWAHYTAEEKKQRQAAGIQRGTFWKRKPDGTITSVPYRDMPIAGLLTAILGAKDLRIAKPEVYKSRGKLEHLLYAMATGVLAVKDANAIGTLTEAMGASPYSTNPEEDLMKTLMKLPLNAAAGFIPTVVKDADIINDPRFYKPEGIMEEFIRQVPIARRTVGGGIPQLNALGEEIKLNRQPWSRMLIVTDSSIAHNRLASLLANGVRLPSASTSTLVPQRDGSRLSVEDMGPQAEHDYLKTFGSGLKDYLTSPDGAALLTMPPDKAQDRLDNMAKILRAKAVYGMTGRKAKG